MREGERALLGTKFPTNVSSIGAACVRLRSAVALQTTLLLEYGSADHILHTFGSAIDLVDEHRSDVALLAAASTVVEHGSGVACCLVSHCFSRGIHMGDTVFGLPLALFGVIVGTLLRCAC